MFATASHMCVTLLITIYKYKLIIYSSIVVNYMCIYVCVLLCISEYVRHYVKERYVAKKA